MKIRVAQIAGTKITVYSAWEPCSLHLHSTITLIDGEWYGRVGTRPLTAELNSLPASDERIKAVDAWHEAQYQEAYAAIEAQYPGLTGHKSMGEISVVG
jgi:hypothetical protein